MKSMLRKLSDRKEDLSKQETIDSIMNEVDGYVRKSLNAQRKLSGILNEVKKLTFFDNRKKDPKTGQMIRQRIDDRKLKSILSEKGYLNKQELVDTALVYRNQERGRFTPPLLSGDVIQKFEGMNKIPRELILMIQNRLIDYSRQSVPLIPREDEK